MRDLVARWGWIPVLAGALALWAPGVATGSIVNGDDAIYASVFQRIATGTPFFEALGWRPPLFYVLGASSVALFGLSEWGLRFASLVCGLAALGATWAAARTLFPRHLSVALTSTALLIATGQFFLFARRVRGLDLLLAALLALTIAVAASAAGRRSRWAIVGVLIGLLIWTKSVVFVTAGPALLVLWWCDFDAIKPRIQIAGIVAGIVGAMAAAWWAAARWFGFGMSDHLENHVARRAGDASLVAAAETSAGYYMEQLFTHEGIWALGAIAGLVFLTLKAVRKGRSEAVVLAWALGVLVPFSLVSTKLPHYMLPAYPALALGVAAALASLGDRIGRGDRVASALGLTFGACCLVLSPIGVLGSWGHADFSPHLKSAALAANEELGEGATLAIWNTYHVAANFYFDGSALLWTDAPGFLQAYRATHGFVEGTHFAAVDVADIPSRLAEGATCLFVPEVELQRLHPVLSTLPTAHARSVVGGKLFCSAAD